MEFPETPQEPGPASQPAHFLPQGGAAGRVSHHRICSCGRLGAAHPFMEEKPGWAGREETSGHAVTEPPPGLEGATEGTGSCIWIPGRGDLAHPSAPPLLLTWSTLTPGLHISLCGRPLTGSPSCPPHPPMGDQERLCLNQQALLVPGRGMGKGPVPRAGAVGQRGWPCPCLRGAGWGQLARRGWASTGGLVDLLPGRDNLAVLHLFHDGAHLAGGHSCGETDGPQRQPHMPLLPLLHPHRCPWRALASPDGYLSLTYAEACGQDAPPPSPGHGLLSPAHQPGVSMETPRSHPHIRQGTPGLVRLGSRGQGPKNLQRQACSSQL